MNRPAASHFSSVLLQSFFLFFVGSLFLSVGADYPDSIRIRIIGGAILAVLFFFVFRKTVLIPEERWTFLFLVFFILFQVVRLIWALTFHFLYHLPESEAFPYGLYVKAPLRWAFYAVFIYLAAVYASDRKRVEMFVRVLVWASFFISLNAIPPLLSQGHFAYKVDDGTDRFFYPAFYFHEWVGKYVMSPITHSNFVGDFIAIGAYAGAGMVFYAFLVLREKIREKRRLASENFYMNLIHHLLLYGVATLTNLAAIILLFSRGTMMSLVATLLLYTAVVVIRFKLYRYFFPVLFVMAAGIGFLFWAGNLTNAWKELNTLQGEMSSQKGSIETNIEGAKRAKAIFKDYPVWGAGTGGYEKLSMKYATPGTVDTAPLAKFQSMNHFLHMLAEEGLGGILYILFLLVYAAGFVRKLFAVKSRYQFVTALSVLMPVAGIFAHSLVNDLLQRFSTSMLVYLLMGAGLGILRKDFGHHAS